MQGVGTLRDIQCGISVTMKGKVYMACISSCLLYQDMGQREMLIKRVCDVSMRERQNCKELQFDIAKSRSRVQYCIIELPKPKCDVLH